MNLNTFLDEIVFGWIKNDLERMTTEIPVRSGQAGNINFPLALCVLAYMEYLGGFLLGENKKFFCNVKEYIDQCFDRPNEYPIEILRDIFRNGLAHEYFARGAISRDGEKPAIFKVFNGSDIWAILDVETLVDDFLKSLQQFKIKLTEQNFQKRMSSALQSIERMKNDCSPLIKLLPTRSTSASTVMSSSRASGYSGPSGPIENTTTFDHLIK